MVAQTIHAAGESSSGNLPENTTAVALAVRDEDELLSLEAALNLSGIAHKAIREPDAPYNGALVAIGIKPGPRDPLRKLLGRLRLLR